jgi:polar amino acid transport system substrate-binding protein
VHRRTALQALASAAGLGASVPGQATDLVFQTAAQAGVPFKFDLKSPDKPGICIELAHALTKADPALRFEGLARELPLRRIEADLAGGQLDVFFALIQTPERAAVRFLPQPVLYAVRHQVAVRANDAVDVQSLQDIRKLGNAGVIITTQGTAYPQYLDDFQGLMVDTSTSHNGQALKMLLAGRGRFFYQGDSTLRNQIKADGLEAQVRILPTVFKVDEQLVAYAPALAAPKLQRLQKALEQLDKAGELARLRARYGL